MGVGCNHYVTGGVRKKVEKNKIVMAPVQEQVLAIPAGILAVDVAEDAALAFDPLGDVTKSPGAPQVVHIACRQELRNLTPELGPRLAAGREPPTNLRPERR